MGRVQGKVALITGGGHGQGRSHAVRLAEEGADIVVVDVCEQVSEHVHYPMATVEELQETARLVEERDRRVLARRADVRSFDQLKAVVDEAVAEFGHIDIVCANAGLITYGSGWELPEEAFDAVIAVNLKGVWNTLRAVVPPMIEARRGGSIVITSSSAGLRGQVPYAHYVASKHGVVGLMKAFSNELARYRIRVNSVHPTGVDTTMVTDTSVGPLMESEPLMLLGATNTLPDLSQPWDAPYAPVGLIEPRDVSEAVLWLASDESRYVTGAQLPVDAGTTNKP